MRVQIALASIALLCTAADGDISTEAPPWIQAGAVVVLAALSINEQQKTRKSIEEIKISMAKIEDRQRRRLRIVNKSDNPPFGDDEEAGKD